MEPQRPVWDEPTDPGAPGPAVRTTRPRAALPQPPRRRRGRGLVAGAVVLIAGFLLGIAIAGALGDRPDDTPAPTVTLEQAVSVVTVSGDEGLLDGGAASDTATTGG